MIYIIVWNQTGRDINAAINIKNAGIKILAESICCTR